MKIEKCAKVTGICGKAIILMCIMTAVLFGLCSCTDKNVKEKSSSEFSNVTTENSATEGAAVDISTTKDAAEDNAATENDTEKHTEDTASENKSKVMISFVEAGKYKNGRRVVDDDIYLDKKITLYSDKTYTLEQYGYDTIKSIWDSFEENSYTLYSDTSDPRSGINAPTYDISEIDGEDGNYYLKPEGSDEEDWTLALDVSDKDGAAALELQSEQMDNISGSNEDTSYTSPAYISIDSKDENGTYVKIDNVVILNSDNPGRCHLYGYDTKNMKDRVIIDNNQEGFSYIIDEKADCSYIDQSNYNVVRCKSDEFLKQLKEKGSMLVQTTTLGAAVTDIKEIK